MFTEDVLRNAVEQGAADIFLIPGMPLSWKVGGKIIYQSDEKIFPKEIEEMVREIYALANNRSMDHVVECGDDDFAMALPGVSRFRVNVFRQRGSLAAIIRVITFDLPDFRNLNIPQVVIDISRMTKGFVLVTGPAGSGKSTTLACIIDQINKTRNAHVITLEDPIEYLHRHNQSVVTQREIGLDTESYVTGLRAALRQAPDVILVGEMRDEETIKTALTAAETGNLVIATMQAVVSQQLIPKVEGGVVPAFEVMFFNNAIRNLIRESKIHQIDNIIATSQEEGMITMDNSIIKLFREGKISKENAIIYSSNGELMEKKLARL